MILLCIQALFAGSEISLLSCDKATIKSKADSGNSSAQIVMKSIDKIEEYVATSLVGENLCIVINTVLLSSFIEENYIEYDPHLLSILILTPLIVIFGQVVPKSIFQRQSNFFVLKTIHFSRFFRLLFMPFLFLIEFLTNFIVRIIGTKNKLITREELMHELEIESALESSTQQFRDKILNKILLFDKVTVKDIMIPIDDSVLISINKTTKDVRRLVKKTGFSRFPVYDFSKSQIKGTIHACYFLDEDENKSIDSFLDKCFFVHEDSLVSTLLNEMKNARSHMAIVGTAREAIGLVTLEDIFEEILGEIEDEHDY
ncbi:HlyC/CorC family transporter [bacterium]|nr:HlyC/CorC family transporter [bacterium]